MYGYYLDYRWKEGKPVGISTLSREASQSFRIVSDPYHKWLSIEMYKDGGFSELVYDSRLLDFRKLKPNEQLAWRKESIDSQESWIYNEDDRVVLRERYSENYCEIFSPHGLRICRYALLKDEARVVLLDNASHPVMSQQYRVYDRGEFVDLIEEDWSPTQAYPTVQMQHG